MRLAILDCDYLYDNLKQDYISYPHMFIKAFEAANHPISYEIFSAIDRQLPKLTHEFDGWVIMGSKFGAYDDYPWIHELKAFICELYAAEEKLSGICFGHQVIHQSLGGQVRKAAVGWGVGVHDYQLRQRPLWTGCSSEDVPEHLSIIVSHQDQVAVPAPGTRVVAGSSFCPNAICEINNRVFTCQAHPEFTPDYSRILMNIRRTCIGIEKVQLAEMSLLKTLDSMRVLRWLHQLFAQPRVTVGSQG